MYRIPLKINITYKYAEKAPVWGQNITVIIVILCVLGLQLCFFKYYLLFDYFVFFNFSVVDTYFL